MQYSTSAHAVGDVRLVSTLAHSMLDKRCGIAAQHLQAAAVDPFQRSSALLQDLRSRRHRRLRELVAAIRQDAARLRQHGGWGLGKRGCAGRSRLRWIRQQLWRSDARGSRHWRQSATRGSHLRAGRASAITEAFRRPLGLAVGRTQIIC